MAKSFKKFREEWEDDEWGDDHADKKLRGRSKTIKDRARSKSIGYCEHEYYYEILQIR